MRYQVAFFCAVGAAFALGGSAVLQHTAAAAYPDLGTVGLISRLVRTPRWLTGRALDLLALFLHAVALAHGPLVLVQSLLATSLLVALGIGALADHHRLSREDWTAAGAIAFGLLVLLTIGRPRRGAPPSVHDWVGICLVSLAGCAAVVAISPRLTRHVQAAAFGIVAGALFAVDAAFLKAAVGRPHHGWATPLHRWETIGFLATALLGNLLVARAFQRAPLSVSLPGVTAAEPVTAIVIGLAFFSEHVRPGLPARVAEVAALACLVLGVVHLARSPALQPTDVETPQEPDLTHPSH